MKNIHDPEYAKIKTLLQSSIKGDVILGLEYIIKEFNKEDLLYNFPNSNGAGNFPTKYNYTMWIRKDDIVIGTGNSIYAFFDEDENWTNHFKNEEIK